MAREEDVKNLVAKTVAQYGRPDAAFNNTGVEWMGPLTEATDYRRAFGADVWGVPAAMKYEVPGIIKAGAGQSSTRRASPGTSAGPG